MYATHRSRWRIRALAVPVALVATFALGLPHTSGQHGASGTDLNVTLIRRVSSPTTTTTLAPSPTTTTTTVPTSVSPLWSTGMEGGTTNDWSADGGGGIYNSGSYEVVVSNEQAHSGGQSLRARIWTPSSPTSGVRAFRWKEPRAVRDLYFSAWMYIPTDFTLTADPNTGQFWNVFQFKSRTTDGSRNDPVWALYAAPNGAGGYYLRAGWGWGGTTLAGPYSTSNVSGKWYEPSSRVTIGVGRWVHLEAFLHQSKDFDGALQVWQDGVQIFNFSGIRTSYDNCTYNSWCSDNEWAVNLYSDGMTPNPATVYIDDAEISTAFIN